VIDCGDISNTPFDKLVAIQELQKGMEAINNQEPKNGCAGDAVRLITIGGDHTISKLFDTSLTLYSFLAKSKGPRLLMLRAMGGDIQQNLSPLHSLPELS
jgi:hypothetical protein